MNSFKLFRFAAIAVITLVLLQPVAAATLRDVFGAFASLGKENPEYDFDGSGGKVTFGDVITAFLGVFGLGGGSIACGKVADCPEATYGGSFCDGNSLMAAKTDYNCLNPGTPSSRCHASTQNVLQEACPYGCKDGACTPIAPTCTDSDGGYDFYKYGEVIDVLGRIYKDACITDLSGLAEFKCRTDGLYTSQFHSCVNDNMICSQGACVPAPGNSWCTDSDGGLTFDQYGLVEYSVEGTYYSAADNCSGQAGVVETHCGNKQKWTQYHSCVNEGNVCVQGACVPAAGNSWCTDSDGGYNFNKYGIVEYSVEGQTGSSADQCVSIYELVEVACSANQKTTQFHSCKEDGLVCIDGACVNQT